MISVIADKLGKARSRARGGVCILTMRVCGWIGGLTTYLGGAENVHVLIRPLELLVCGEESHIRDRALKSAEDIVSRMSEEQVMRHFVPLIQKLSSKDW